MPLVGVSILSLAFGAWGALTLSAPKKLPRYAVDLPRLQPASSSPTETIWLRPRSTPPTALPKLCTFTQGDSGAQFVPLPYSLSATGSLHLDAMTWSRQGGELLLVLGASLPPCRVIGWLSRLGGSHGRLFRALVLMVGGQILSLPAREPSVEETIQDESADP